MLAVARTEPSKLFTMASTRVYDDTISLSFLVDTDVAVKGAICRFVSRVIDYATRLGLVPVSDCDVYDTNFYDDVTSSSSLYFICISTIYSAKYRIMEITVCQKSKRS